jgi:acetyltransferase-like isoleucine patch superfamily enzyme
LKSSKDVSIGSWVFWTINSMLYLLYLILDNVNILDNVTIGTPISGDVDAQNVLIGNKVCIRDNVTIGTSKRKFDNTVTQVGDNVYICDCIIGTYVNNNDKNRSVKIAKNVAIGDIACDLSEASVVIGSGVNIGARVNITGDLTISQDSTKKHVWFSWKDGSDTDNSLYVNSIEQQTITGNANLSTNKALFPNIYYIINNVANANITFKSGLDDVMNNYMFQIEVVSPPEGSEINISIDEDIRWANGIAPSYEAGKIYQISVINNLGVFTEF